MAKFRAGATELRQAESGAVAEEPFEIRYNKLRK